MNDKITEIRARHERIQRDCTLATPPVSMAGQVAAVDAHEDRATLLDLAEWMSAENDELYRAAGRTRAALSGWVLASPDREDEPTHALVAAVVAEVEKQRADLERLRAAATSAGAALAAAIELLERGREDAPSKRMFSQMLADYRVIVARTRKALEDKP